MRLKGAGALSVLLGAVYFIWHCAWLPETLDLDQLAYTMRASWVTPKLLHPHHLLHDTGNIWMYRLFSWPLYTGRIDDLLRLKSLFMAALCLAVIFRLLYRYTGWFALPAVGLIMASHGFWHYSTAVETPMAALLFTWLAIDAFDRRKAIRGAAWFCLAVLFHQIKVLAVLPLFILSLNRSKFNRRQRRWFFFMRRVLLFTGCAVLIFAVYAAAGLARQKSLDASSDVKDNFYQWMVAFSYVYTPLKSGSRKTADAIEGLEDTFTAAPIPYTFKRTFPRSEDHPARSLFSLLLVLHALAAVVMTPLLMRMFGRLPLVLTAWFFIEALLAWWWEAHHFEFWLAPVVSGIALMPFIWRALFIKAPRLLRLPLVTGGGYLAVVTVGWLFLFNFSTAVGPRHYWPVHGFTGWLKPPFFEHERPRAALIGLTKKIVPDGWVKKLLPDLQRQQPSFLFHDMQLEKPTKKFYEK